MKYILTMLLSSASLLIAAQTPQVKVSPNKDTLWLVDDSTGHLIAATWKDSLPPKPVIIFVPIDQVEKMRSDAALKHKRKKKK